MKGTKDRRNESSGRPIVDSRIASKASSTFNEPLSESIGGYFVDISSQVDENCYFNIHLPSQKHIYCHMLQPSSKRAPRIYQMTCDHH